MGSKEVRYRIDINMGCNTSKILQQIAPTSSQITLSPEVLILLANFNNKYPELKIIFVSSNNLTVDKKKEFDSENIIFLDKVPVPTVDELYIFLLKQIKKYNIIIKPEDTKVQKLVTDFGTKYSYMQEYLDNIKTLSIDQQVEANKTMQDFLETYPLGSVDDMYNLCIIVLKQYNLILPPDAQGFCNFNSTKTLNYSKISVKMDEYVEKNALLEKQYALFNR